MSSHDDNAIENTDHSRVYFILGTTVIAHAAHFIIVRFIIACPGLLHNQVGFVDHLHNIIATTSIGIGYIIIVMRLLDQATTNLGI